MFSQLRLTIGTGGEHVFRTGAAKPKRLAHVPRPTFLTRARGGIYGVSEIGHGNVIRIGVDPIMGTGGSIAIGGVDRQPLASGVIGEPISSGGAHPCHISASPDGGWLYVANYGDGLVRAIELDEHGRFGQTLDLPHAGHGADPARQTGPHAHFAEVVDDWLVIADLGTDELRVHKLVNGRPEPEAVLVGLPAGSGPRHFARVGEHLIVAGELNGSLTEVEIGSWRRGRTIPAATSKGAHNLSHILCVDEYILVAVRGANTVSVLDRELTLVSEVKTAAWPRHFALAETAQGRGVVVAGERSNEVVWHEWSPGHLGEISETLRVPSPMFIGVGDQF